MSSTKRSPWLGDLIHDKDADRRGIVTDVRGGTLWVILSSRQRSSRREGPWRAPLLRARGCSRTVAYPALLGPCPTERFPFVPAGNAATCWHTTWSAYGDLVANEHLGRTLRRLRRLAALTQEELAERSDVSVDVIRQLEQQRKHSARLPTLHALANALGVELTTLLGDPPAVASTGENDGPRFVAVRRAITPVMWGPQPEPPGPNFSLDGLRDRIADGWSRYHAAEFDMLMKVSLT